MCLKTVHDACWRCIQQSLDCVGLLFLLSPDVAAGERACTGLLDGLMSDV